MSARVHTNTSNRAKARETLEKKVVFKSVLDSPFRVPWPSVPLNLQNTALACTLSLLGGVSEYRSVRGEANRKRKRLDKDSRQIKKTKNADGDASVGEMDVDAELPDAGAPSEEFPERPAVLSHLAIGINEVTKRLDAQIRSLRKAVSVTPHPAVDPTPLPLTAPIKVIVVCRTDVDPSVLIDHLPHEVAAFNSSQPSEPIMMIPLPKGAEKQLADAVGLRRAAVIAMDINTPGLEMFASILESVPTLTASWLTSLAASATPGQQQLIPTYVKQLRTTAPKDMKMAKVLRAEGKAAARARKTSSKEAKMQKKTTVTAP
ncbi:hypothetical protein C8F04DRAFT_256567 [Mycena alexandri]|uniref:Uncharacterized protein n=1 Tax=Mycena alexandri TaxID=1745969 RepID=A0AAD6T631_9AGAR|nr:hypothetical protein C8F04DRAFT_256567 [Mycena alexandri]